jgi:hypothetical protein
VPVLHRLVDSFDAELQQNAIEEETRLQTQGFPIFDEARGAWLLHSLPIVTAIQARRECCRVSRVILLGTSTAYRRSAKSVQRAL